MDGRARGVMALLQPAKDVWSALPPVRPCHPFVVVSEGWSSCLITLLALRLPIVGAFPPVKWHRYFKVPIHNLEVTPWLPLRRLDPHK